MDYIYIGRIITTHGLKGEIKIRSNFKYKEQIFKEGITLYIGKQKEPHQIKSYRKHQDYDMLVLTDIDDIDIAIKYKQELVYALKTDIALEENDYFDDDLIGFKAYYNDKEIGIIKSIEDEGNNNIIIKLDSGIYIPKNKHFIKQIEADKKEIHFQNMEGLL